MIGARYRIGELARCRAAAMLSEEDCMVWFGVGRATLERVEAGEIEPGEELEQRIDRYLQVCGGGSPSAALPGPSFEHDGGPTGAGARAPDPGASFREAAR